MAKELVKSYKKRKLRDFIGLLLLMGFLLFLWQLYRAPIAVPFLKPYIIKALNHDDMDFEVTLDSVNLELVRSIKPIKIIANNVSYKKLDGSFAISAPKTSVSFSMRALLKGMVAPSSISIISPKVYVFKTYGLQEEAKEEISEKKIESYFESFNDFMERFNSEDKSYTESYINNITIKNAEVEFHEVELGKKWVFSDLNYEFNRNFTNIKMDFSALLKFGEIITPIGLEAEFRPSANKLALQLYISDFVPFNSLGTVFDAQIKVPLSGKIETIVDLKQIIANKTNLVKGVDSAISKIAFEFEGAQGNIAFVHLPDYQYKISSFLLKGNIEGGLDKLQIDNAEFDLDGQKTSIDFNASGMKKVLLQNDYKDVKLKIVTRVPTLPLDKLSDYWPKNIATPAWSWCKDSIRGGEAKNSYFVFDFAFDEKNKRLEFKNLNGEVNIVDSNLDYLDGMPIVNNVYAKALFYSDSIKIEVEKGVSNGVSVNGGYVRLYDLSKNHQFADIQILASSSVADALKIIDHPPLGYAKELGLSPDMVDGQAQTDLKLNFELKQNLHPQDVLVDVKAELFDLTMPKAISGKDLKAEQLDLTVTNAGMLIEGKTNFDGIPIELFWKDEFNNKNYKSKYKLTFLFDDLLKKKLDLNFSLLNAPNIVGNPVMVAEITTYDKNKTVIDINADLINTKLDFSFLGIKKNLGVPANITTKIELQNDKLQAIPSFSFTKSDFNLSGSVALDAQKRIKFVDINNIKGNKTFAKARIDVGYTPKTNFKINLSGDSYNLTDFFAKDDEVKSNNPVENKEEDDAWEKVNDANILIAVNNLWTNNDLPIKNFAGSVKLKNGVGVEELHLIGNFGNSKTSMIKVDYIPRGNEFVLDIDSTNAGATLKVLGLYDNMKGGILQIEGKRNAQKLIIGHAKIRDFSLHNTPVLAKLLTVASLSGMVNLLTGEGMSFSHLDAPFEYQHKILSVTEAKAFGNVMGITANGTYNRRSEDYDIKGVIAPAYSLNSLIGKIPVVGDILMGRDGTVFAANYQILGNVDDPEIKINPFSALSPSSLKDLMGSVFGE